MMNAEVTAENRPACNLFSACTAEFDTKTYKNESGVQILVVLLHEFPIVVPGLLPVVFVELSPRVLLSGR